MSDTTVLPNVETVEALSRRLKEPEWLAAWRRHAYEVYQATPAPHRANHLWRYTDPAEFEPSADPFIAVQEALPKPGRSERLLTSGLDKSASAAALLIESELAEITIGKEAARAGVGVFDLRTAAVEQPEQLRRVFGTLVSPEHGRYDALNGAAFVGGLFIHVPKGVTLEKPIHLRSVQGKRSFAAQRVALLVEDGASVTLVNELEGGPDQGALQFNQVTEVLVGADCRVQLVTVQHLSQRTTAYLTGRTSVGRGSVYIPVLAAFGSALVKMDLGALLDGVGAETEMIGFLCGVGKQRFDHHTVLHHRAARTRSNLDFRTVLKDRSRSAYTGLIRIEPEAAHSEAYQENRNLLLSENCRATSIPELEIITEEVQCKHGATVGPLDPGHLFYLMSRGIPRPEAVRMIVGGHFEPTLRRLPEGLQDRMQGLLAERLQAI